MKTFKKILIDIVPVTFGVLIALFISNLKQSFDDQKFLDKMYGTIASEMKSNVEGMDEVIDNHYAFIDSIESNLNNEVSLAELFSLNFQKANVKNTGWQSFTNSKLELVDFEVISTLTTLEEIKSGLNLKFDKLMDFVIHHLNSTKQDDKITLRMLVINLIDSEESMVRIQKEYLDWYEKEIKE
ncbi:MAG: hypothetical protein NXI20_23910 [bacterium]|nr:hypothetical protein [bacterium]